MPISKKTARKAAPPRDLPEAFYRLTALLHTIRCIAQHEDRLCLLRSEIKRTKTVAPALLKELNTFLEELPSDDYTNDLQAVEWALSSSPSKPARAIPKKAARKPPEAKAGQKAIE